MTGTPQHDPRDVHEDDHRAERPVDTRSVERAPSTSRRRFLRGGLFGGGALVGAGAALAFGADRPGTSSSSGPTDEAGREVAPVSSLDVTGANGTEAIAFHGEHQAGIETPPQTNAVFLAFDLRPEVDRDGLRRLMRILTDDAARLTQGEGALADTEPELATMPARLTVTFGFGPGFVERAGGEGPTWLRPLPPFGIDRLEDAWSGGDLLIHIGSDDPTTTAHAQRMLAKDTRAFASPRWVQRGFRHAYGTHPQGVTMRNLFGQVDGTVNVRPGTAEFGDVVWTKEGWMKGGTGVVVRRIRMNLDSWDLADRAARDNALGRRQSDGAPLTGEDEFDEPDFEAVDQLGFPVIPEYSHIARARNGAPGLQIFRRAYNYDDSPIGVPPLELGLAAAGSAEDTDMPEAVSNAGLLFVAYQADVDAQFVPIQRALDEEDILNVWTVPVGSAVFAIPPGCAEGGYIGETLLA